MSVSAWKFVQTCQQPFCRALPNCNFLSILKNENRSFLNSPGFRFCFHRKFHHLAKLSCPAQMLYWTFLAFCHAIWHTDKRTKFNQALIKITCRLFRNDPLQHILYFCLCTLFHNVIFTCQNSR